jgi:hypothetical protein
MKKIILCASLFFIVANAQAQLSIDGGVKGSYNSTWLFNKNISDQGTSQDYAMGWGYNVGGGATVYYGPIGLGVEFLTGTHTGGYAGETLLGKYTSNVKLNVTQIPLLLKLKSKVTGPYVELGAQFNTISKATYNRTYDNSSLLNVSDGEVSDEYSKTFTSAVLGFGINMRWSESLPLNIHAGLRLNYGFSDAKGVDAQRVSLSEKLVYPTYQKTNAVSGGLVFGLTYTFEPK